MSLIKKCTCSRRLIHIRNRFAGLMVCLLVICLLSPMQTQASELDEQEAAAAAGQAAALEEAASVSASLGTLQAELSEITTQLEEINTQLEETAEELEEKTDDLQDAEFELMQAEEDYDKQYEDMSLRIKYTYENSTQDTLTMILESEDLSEVINRIEMVNLLSAYDQDRQLDLMIALGAVEQKKLDLEEEKEALIAVQEELTEQKEAADAEVTRYNETIAGYEGQLAAAQAQAQAYAGQLADIQAQRDAIADAAQTSGNQVDTGEDDSSDDSDDQKEQKKTPAQNPAYAASASDYELLAHLIFCEAGGEPYEGQVAVGAVVMNRVNSSSFPNNIRDVIYQSYQFAPAFNGMLDQAFINGNACYAAANDALAGIDPTGGCLFFRSDNGGPRKLTIGHQIFR